MYDNSDNMIISDTTNPCFENEEKRIKWLRAQPRPYQIPSPNARLEELGNYMEYCSEASEKQQILMMRWKS